MVDYDIKFYPAVKTKSAARLNIFQQPLFQHPNFILQMEYLTYGGYPAKRALSAMRKHAG